LIVSSVAVITSPFANASARSPRTARGEHRLERRRPVAADPESRALAGRGILLRVRVHEQQQASAAEHVLVDRVLQCVRQSLRLHDHQHVESRRERRRIRRDRAHVEQLTHLFVDRPAGAHAAGGGVEAG
jgi:hypothetical protein